MQRPRVGTTCFCCHSTWAHAAHALCDVPTLCLPAALLCHAAGQQGAGRRGNLPHQRRGVGRLEQGGSAPEGVQVRPLASQPALHGNRPTKKPAPQPLQLQLQLHPWHDLPTAQPLLQPPPVRNGAAAGLLSEGTPTWALAGPGRCGLAWCGTYAAWTRAAMRMRPWQVGRPTREQVYQAPDASGEPCCTRRCSDPRHLLRACKLAFCDLQMRSRGTSTSRRPSPLTSAAPRFAAARWRSSSTPCLGTAV